MPSSQSYRKACRSSWPRAPNLGKRQRLWEGFLQKRRERWESWFYNAVWLERWNYGIIKAKYSYTSLYRLSSASSETKLRQLSMSDKSSPLKLEERDLQVLFAYSLLEKIFGIKSITLSASPLSEIPLIFKLSRMVYFLHKEFQGLWQRYLPVTQQRTTDVWQTILNQPPPSFPPSEGSFNSQGSLLSKWASSRPF